MSSRILKKTEKTAGDSGYTIIEVLIAVAIFAIGFLAVGSMQLTALTTSNSARRTTQAMAAVENQVELLMALPFYADDNNFDDDGVDGDNNPSTPNDDFDVPPEFQPKNASSPHLKNIPGPYTVLWTVTPDVPIPAYESDVFVAGMPLTRSRTIRVWVTRDNDANEVLAQLEFAKFYRMDK